MIKFDKKIDFFDHVLDFIVENYQIVAYPRVLEIAVGKGDFSYRLSEYGYQVTAMDSIINFQKDVCFDLLLQSFSNAFYTK